MIKNNYIFFLILIFVCCSKNENIILSTNNLRSTIKGKIYDAQDLFPVKSAAIRIDNFISITDSLGFFEFNQIQTGIKEINITHPHYDTLNFSVKIKTDTLLLCYINPIMGDFWPLEINNSWNYIISYSNRDDLGSQTIEGEMSIKVNSKSVLESVITYDLTTDLDYIKHIMEFIPDGTDTTYSIENEIKFKITEQSNGSIEFQFNSPNTILSLLKEALYSVNLKRFYPIRMGNPFLIFKNTQTIIHLERGKGPIIVDYVQDVWKAQGFFKMELACYNFQ